MVLNGTIEHGVPQRLLSYIGLALNPSRRGGVRQLGICVTALGVGATTSETEQTHYVGQERTLPSDPVPLP